MVIAQLEIQLITSKTLNFKKATINHTHYMNIYSSGNED